MTDESIRRDVMRGLIAVAANQDPMRAAALKVENASAQVALAHLKQLKEAGEAATALVSKPHERAKVKGLKFRVLKQIKGGGYLLVSPAGEEVALIKPRAGCSDIARHIAQGMTLWMEAAVKLGEDTERGMRY